MIPPTSIDGTDITGATIDGTDVQEITVDGDTVFSAGPAANVVDNFEDAPVGPYATGQGIADIYTGDTGIASRSTAEVFEGSKSLELSRPSATGRDAISSTTGLPRYPQRGETFEVRVNEPPGTSSECHVLFGVVTETSFSNIDCYAIRLGGNNMLLRRLDNGSFAPTLDTTSVSFPGDEWMKLQIDWGSNDLIDVTLFDASGSQIGNVSATDSTYANASGIGFESFDAGDYYFDSFEVV